MRTTIALLAAVLLLVLTATPSRSQVPPPFISYQGLLQDAAGNPVPDGVYPLTFRLFNEPEGGEPLWEERHDDVKVTNGVFNVLLGSLTRLEPSLFESETWITVTFREERMPRFRIGAVPYSVQALSSQFASKTGDLFGLDGSIKIGDCVPGGTGPCLEWDTREGLEHFGEAAFRGKLVFHDGFHTTSALVQHFHVDNSAAFGDCEGGACLEWNRDTGLNATCPAGAESCLDVDGPVEFGDCEGGACLAWNNRLRATCPEGGGICLDVHGDASIAGTLQADKIQTSLSIIGDCDTDGCNWLEPGILEIWAPHELMSVPSPVILFDARAGEATVDIKGTLQAREIEAEKVLARHLEAEKVLARHLEAEVKNFRIDHPLDPAGKYLYHTSVESPDMLNLYNGTVTLDASGQALVQLPTYFEALNRDFRYQLTCIGGFAPVYVAEKISGNRFKIAGGVPGLEVSWQVTGVRKDPYAEAHRSPVEADKPVGERGTYLHPELYGQPSVRR